MSCNTEPTKKFISGVWSSCCIPTLFYQGISLSSQLCISYSLLLTAGSTDRRPTDQLVDELISPQALFFELTVENWFVSVYYRHDEVDQITLGNGASCLSRLTSLQTACVVPRLNCVSLSAQPQTFTQAASLLIL